MVAVGHLDLRAIEWRMMVLDPQSVRPFAQEVDQRGLLEPGQVQRLDVR